MWRDHIKFFVNYTVATAKKDTAGQTKAVNDLKPYTGRVRRLPRRRHRPAEARGPNDLLGHVLELKGQLDAYAAGNYPKARACHSAYNHMFMTGAALAGGIASQKGLK